MLGISGSCSDLSCSDLSDLNMKAKLSIYQLIYVLTLTYGYELWIVAEKIISQIQMAEISFLLRVASLSL